MSGTLPERAYSRVGRCLSLQACGIVVLLPFIEKKKGIVPEIFCSELLVQLEAL